MSEINCNLSNTTIDKAQVMLTVYFMKNVKKNLLIKTSILLVVKRKSTNFAARMV